MIRVEGLTKYYGDKLAVREASFEVRPGEVLGLLGLNGAGKTTILRVLAGDLAPSAGQVLIDGRVLDPAEPGARRHVGFLPETPPIYPEMSCRAFLGYLAGLRGVPRREVPARVSEALGRFGLSDVADQASGTLSFGYRKRLGLAQASVHRPRLLILDEPITGLDPVQIVEVRQKIREMAGEHTVILSSHILGEISQTCDRILVIKDGVLVAQGSEEALLQQVGRGRALHLELRAPAAQALALLSALPGVTGARVLAEHDGVSVLELHTAQDLREAAARLVVGAGFGLLRLQPAGDQLEQLFLQLIGGPGGAGGGATGAPDVAGSPTGDGEVQG